MNPDPNTVFGVEILRVTESGITTNRFASFSFGNDSGTNPTGTGQANYNGVMIGTTNPDNIVQGDATVIIDDLSISSMEVEFTNIRNLHTGATIQNIAYSNLTLTDGNFSAEDPQAGSIEGTFYGSNHEEVGGIFEVLSGTFGREGIIGSFGARRQ